MLLSTKNLSIGYNHEVIKDINISIESSLIYCLIGKNGIGKSTLLKTLLGLIPVLNGNVYFGHTNISTLSFCNISKEIAYIPQKLNCPFDLTVLDFTLLGLNPYLNWNQSPNRDDENDAISILTSLRIEHLAYKFINQISGGECQLVFLARALIQRPKLIIMDEPAASLDFGNQIRLIKIIQNLKYQGISILMSTHHPTHAKIIADSIIALLEYNKETICIQDLPDNLLKKKNLARIYEISETDLKYYI